MRSKNAISARLGRTTGAAAQGGPAAAAAAAAAAEAKQQQAVAAPIAGGTGGGGGRGALSLPSRSALFFGGVVRGSRGLGGGSSGGGGGSGGDPVAAAAGTHGGSGGAAGGKENGGGGAGADMVYPALSRLSAPRGEPLCCKRLAQMPLSQVVVVRAGVVTLCGEGLLKLWARPSMPPPLPPLAASGPESASNKVRERGSEGARKGRTIRAAVLDRW